MMGGELIERLMLNKEVVGIELPLVLELLKKVDPRWDVLVNDSLSLVAYETSLSLPQLDTDLYFAVGIGRRKPVDPSYYIGTGEGLDLLQRKLIVVESSLVRACYIEGEGANVGGGSPAIHSITALLERVSTNYHWLKEHKRERATVDRTTAVIKSYLGRRD